MDEYRDLIAAMCVALIPLLPAIALFKSFPSSSTVEGPFAGLQLKLGGAFAGYFVVALLMITVIRLTPVPASAEQWVIHGVVRAGSTEMSPNVLRIRLQPPPQQELDVGPDGHFTLKLVSTRQNGKVLFPRLVFDMSCFSGRTVALDGGSDTFGLAAEPEFKVERDESVRRIDIRTPIALKEAPCPAPASHSS